MDGDSPLPADDPPTTDEVSDVWTRRSTLRAFGGAGVAGLATIGGTDLGSVIVDRGRQTGRITWTQQAKLTANDGDLQDKFGSSVAVDGSTAIVGAYDDKDANGNPAGSVYVFERSGSSWIQELKLQSTGGDEQEYFGISVAIDGSTAIVGAPFDDNSNGEGAGAAYVFERSDDSWVRQATLTPPDGDAQDNFGISVAIDGSTAIIGAFFDEDPNGDAAGSAYVFERDDSVWTQQAKLTADDGDSEDEFGVSVAVDGKTAVIGAFFDEDPNGDRAGSAYVFERRDSSWVQQAKLAANDGSEQDGFGVTVAVDGSTIVVGAGDDDTPNGEGAGSAYVFERIDGTWAQQAKLVATDGREQDGFGFQVAISGPTIIVGAGNTDTPHGEDTGSAYVFERRDSSWTQQTKLSPTDGEEGDNFGTSVAMDGSTAIIGAHNKDISIEINAGAAYIFDGAVSATASATPSQTESQPSPATESMTETAAPADTSTTSATETSTPADTSTTATETSSPGLGISHAVTALGGILYVLRRRVQRQDKD